MKYTLLFLSLHLFVAPVQGDETSAKQTSKDAKSDVGGEFQFDGVWKPKGAILKGDFLPPPALDGIRLTINGDRYEVSAKGEDHSDIGTYSLDTTTTPKRMTIKSTAGPNKGKTFLAIYEVKNQNAMRVCYDLSGTSFPKDFKAPKGTELYTVGYRRQPAKPNIIVIYTDDHGYSDLSCQGVYDDVRTPNIDSLALGGVRMTDGYCTAPQCGPSRAGLISGQYQNRFGMEANGYFDDEAVLNRFRSLQTLPNRLKSAGYTTGMAGKSHLGSNDSRELTKLALIKSYSSTATRLDIGI